MIYVVPLSLDAIKELTGSDGRVSQHAGRTFTVTLTTDDGPIHLKHMDGIEEATADEAPKHKEHFTVSGRHFVIERSRLC